MTVFSLHRGWYEWKFYPESVAGNPQFVDQGTARCNASDGRAGRG